MLLETYAIALFCCCWWCNLLAECSEFWHKGARFPPNPNLVWWYVKKFPIDNIKAANHEQKHYHHQQQKSAIA